MAAQVPEKEITPFNGYCVVHHRVGIEDVERAIASVPGASLLVHPECPEAVVRRVDFVGSTEQIINFATRSPEKVFLIGTEMGILHVLQKKKPRQEVLFAHAEAVLQQHEKDAPVRRLRSLAP